jgi:Cft2 family RNA processing exonuclease
VCTNQEICTSVTESCSAVRANGTSVTIDHGRRSIVHGRPEGPYNPEIVYVTVVVYVFTGNITDNPSILY